MPTEIRLPTGRCLDRAPSTSSRASRRRTGSFTGPSSASWTPGSSAWPGLRRSPAPAPRAAAICTGPCRTAAVAGVPPVCSGQMLQDVPLGERSLADYTHLVGRGLIEEIRERAEPLAGKRVLHVSASAFGGGVAEILYAMVPLMRDVGLEVHWRVILGREEFFNVTKLMHNSLQGDSQSISDQQWEVFEAYNAMNAQGLDDEWDAIIVHDPQPAALRANAADRAGNWIWRCHIDLSTPNEQTLERLLPLLREYDETIWHLQQYVPSDMDGHVRIIPP